MKLEILILEFALYSFLGWLFESTLCSLSNKKRLINRGFLLGPYCPVYGIGASLCYLSLNSLQNPVIFFFLAALLCGIVEYLTGYGMEKLFHAKWWDYSQLPFQLHGRVCLYGAVLFGLTNVVICYWLEPALLTVLSEFDPSVIKAAAVTVVILMGSDAGLTLVGWGNLNHHLCCMREKLQEKTDQAMENMSDFLLDRAPIQIFDGQSGLQIRIMDWNMKLKKGELWFLHAFPNVRLFAYDKFLQKINMKEHIRNVFEKL